MKLATSGLSEQDQLIVNTALKLLTIDGVEFCHADQAVGTAHLVVLDGDDARGKLLLNQTSPGQIKLVISSRPKPARNVIGIKRPLELGMFKGLLKKLYQRMREQICHQADNGGEITAGQVAVLEGTLFNLLHDAKTRKRILHIFGDDVPDLFVDGQKQSLATSATERQLDALADTPLDKIRFNKLDRKNFAVHRNELNVQSLHNLLWMTAVKCSQGRLLAGHDIHSPFALRGWPNFTRYCFKPEYLRLAALLARQPLSIAQLVKMTQVPLGEVINFFNAASAVDLVVFDTVRSQQAGRKRATGEHKQGLFAKIAQRLKLGN